MPARAGRKLSVVWTALVVYILRMDRVGMRGVQAGSLKMVLGVSWAARLLSVLKELFTYH